MKEAKINWVTARRAILRSPIDRIGYGGYLKLALKFPEFIDYVESVCDEFRLLYENKRNDAVLCEKSSSIELLGQNARMGKSYGASCDLL